MELIRWLLDKGSCCQAWQPEIKSWEPSCPWLPHAHTHVHRNDINKNVKKYRCYSQKQVKVVTTKQTMLCQGSWGHKADSLSCPFAPSPQWYVHWITRRALVQQTAHTSLWKQKQDLVAVEPPDSNYPQCLMSHGPCFPPKDLGQILTQRHPSFDLFPSWSFPVLLLLPVSLRRTWLHAPSMSASNRAGHLSWGRNVLNCLLPAEHWVESVGNVMVSVFNDFFAQGYFDVRITLWRKDRWDVISSWGANWSQSRG